MKLKGDDVFEKKPCRLYDIVSKEFIDFEKQEDCAEYLGTRPANVAISIRTKSRIYKNRFNKVFTVRSLPTKAA